MNPAPKVSILLSSYNHEKFVAEAIESVLAQDFADWELIIRDDGSTDHTSEIVTSFRDPRIKVLGSGPRLGGAASLNQCLEVAHGEYVAILNSDDAWLPLRLSTQVEILDGRPEVAAVFSQADIMDENGTTCADDDQFYCTVFNQPNRARKEWLRHFFKKGNCLCHPSALIRKRIYVESGLYDPLLLQLPDFDLWIRICIQHEIHIHQAPLLKFRVLRDGSNASADSPLKRERTAYELTKVLAHYARSPLLAQLHDILPEWIHADDGDAARLQGLANAALAVASSPHHFFAMDCLRQCPQADQAGLPAASRLHLDLYTHARPFSMVFTRSSRCRISSRRAGEAFSDEHRMVRTLNIDEVCHDLVMIPSDTVQLRLEFDGNYHDLQILALTITDRHGHEIWNALKDPASLQVNGARGPHSPGSTALRFLRRDKVTRLLLPEIAPGEGQCLHYTLLIEYDISEILLENENLAKKLKAREQRRLVAVKNDVSTAGTQNGSWFGSFFRRRKLPKE